MRIDLSQMVFQFACYILVELGQNTEKTRESAAQHEKNGVCTCPGEVWRFLRHVAYAALTEVAVLPARSRAWSVKETSTMLALRLVWQACGVSTQVVPAVPACSYEQTLWAPA